MWLKRKGRLKSFRRPLRFTLCSQPLIAHQHRSHAQRFAHDFIGEQRERFVIGFCADYIKQRPPMLGCGRGQAQLLGISIIVGERGVVAALQPMVHQLAGGLRPIVSAIGGVGVAPVHQAQVVHDIAAADNQNALLAQCGKLAAEGEMLVGIQIGVEAIDSAIKY